MQLVTATPDWVSGIDIERQVHGPAALDLDVGPVISQRQKAVVDAILEEAARPETVTKPEALKQRGGGGAGCQG